MTDPTRWTLWGLPHSLYTGPARAYLRKAGIAYVERSPQEPDFATAVLPRIGRAIIPVVTRGDVLVQDSVDIIDHFERDGGPGRAYPPGPRQAVLAALFQLYGSQGLLAHAMHYRWSHYPAQARFIDHAFGLSGGGEIAERTMARMRSYLPGLGVTPATAPLIERSFEALLDTLDAHFRAHPYLLGERASVGDYGLLGPLFAHLGRDPVPSDLMKRRAPAVFRWVERMNASDADLVEFPGAAADYLADDAVPETLPPLIARMGADMGVPLADQIDFLARWVDEHRPDDGAPIAPRPSQRHVGMVATHFLSGPVEIAVAPYLLYMVQRVRRAIDALTATDRAWAEALLAPAGLWRPLTRPIAIGVDRRDHLEVWSHAAAR